MTTADTIDAIPPLFYTHHERRGVTVHRSDPATIRRDAMTLDVFDGARVLEIGTGSGYSGAVLAALAGPHGRVISVDVSEHLVGWATLLHHERGVTTVTCHVADGMAGYPQHAPFDRIVAWCAPPRLPRAWIQQLAEGGRIVACLPIAALPSTALVAAVTVQAGQPHVRSVVEGGYAQSTAAAVDDALTVPGRWVDWSTYHPAPSWIAIAWRHHDDRLRTGARTALDRLLHPGHTETYDPQPLDWRSWTTYTAIIGDPHLSNASLGGQTRGIGHTTPTSAAMLLTDGTIIADSPDSPSLSTLRTWLHRWEHDGRPAASAFTAALVPYDGDDLPGWDLRMSW